jgi:hypothetical protein
VLHDLSHERPVSIEDGASPLDERRVLASLGETGELVDAAADAGQLADDDVRGRVVAGFGIAPKAVSRIERAGVRP